MFHEVVIHCLPLFGAPNLLYWLPSAWGIHLGPLLVGSVCGSAAARQNCCDQWRRTRAKNLLLSACTAPSWHWTLLDLLCPELKSSPKHNFLLQVDVEIYVYMKRVTNKKITIIPASRQCCHSMHLSHIWQQTNNFCSVTLEKELCEGRKVIGSLGHMMKEDSCHGSKKQKL